MKLIQSRAGVCFLLRPSIQSGLSCATKWPAGRFVYAPGLHFFMVRFAPFFLLRPSIMSGLSGATKQPVGCFVHAPPLNLSWRQAS